MKTGSAMLIVDDPNCSQAVPSKLAYPVNTLPTRCKRTHIEGKFTGAIPWSAAVPPTVTLDSKNAPPRLGETKLPANVLFAFSDWRAMIPALAQVSDWVSP